MFNANFKVYGIKLNYYKNSPSFPFSLSLKYKQLSFQTYLEKNKSYFKQTFLD